MVADWDLRRMLGAVPVALVLLCLCFSLFTSSAAAATQRAVAAATSPKRGGVATFAVSDFTTLDPGSPAFTAGVQIQMGYPVFDDLFTPTKSGVAPWLATGYKYTSDFKTVDIYLRPGVKFQDGTPFNSAAVEYNFHRYQTTPNGVSEYFSLVTSYGTPNATTLVVHFSQPDANFIPAIAATQAGFIGSPTAINGEGAKFGLDPVGAGPFKVTKAQPGTEATYTAWPGYWDAKHRYLSGLKATVVASGDATEYTDLQAGDLSFFYDTSQGIPSVMHDAKSNPNLKVVVGPDQTINALQLNTYSPPFNNQLAREALDYCLDRNVIVNHVQQGIGTPAYMWTAPGMSYFSGSKPPAGFYHYNPAKGRAIVKQLGGLSFTINVNDKVSEDEQVEAMASMWHSCGMNVRVNVSATTSLIADEIAGKYQISYATGGGYYDPYLNMSANSESSNATNKYGFSSPAVTKLINESGATTNPTKLKAIWKQVYDMEALLGVNIPVSSSSNYYIFTNKLHGLTFIALAAIYDHAYFT